MFLELSKSGIGPDVSVKFGEFSPLGKYDFLGRKKERKNS